MRKFLALIALTTLVLTVGCGSVSSGTAKNAETQEKKESVAVMSSKSNASLTGLKDKKVLVAYFSWGGNTQKLAQAISQKTGGELFEIQVEKPYPKDYNSTVNQAKEEQASNARPALKGKIADFAQYDVVFLGFPNWWGSAPMPLVTFMAGYDWTGKTVVPFFTHGGGGVQSCNDAVVKNVGQAKVLPYLCVNGSSAGSAGSAVDKWLSDLKF